MLVSCTCCVTAWDGEVTADVLLPCRACAVQVENIEKVCLKHGKQLKQQRQAPACSSSESRHAAKAMGTHQQLHVNQFACHALAEAFTSSLIRLVGSCMCTMLLWRLPHARMCGLVTGAGPRGED